MFRDNEASRVGAVLERKGAGDVAGMIAAATELWVCEPERPGEYDAGAAEVWAAIEEVGAQERAVAAGLALFEKHVRVRSHAFIDLTEAMTPAQLGALIDHVLAARWDAHPYLAAVLFRFGERELNAELLDHITRRADALREDTARWTLVGYVLATTGAGDRTHVDAWFADWRAHADVPMWIMAAYAGSLARLSQDYTLRLAELAAEVYPATRWDVTTAYFVPLLGVGALLRGARDEFLSRVRSAMAIGGTASPPEVLANPIVAYANGAKHRHAISRVDLAWQPELVGRFVDNAVVKELPQAWRLILLVHALDELVVRGERILPLFAQMIELRRGDPRAPQLYRAMQRAHPSDWPPLQPVWKRLARERITPWQRFKLEFFD